jgi:hypothetical protein
MCDYSLEHVASRPARVADRLVTTSFLNTITRGFAGLDDTNTAVCLLPGTEITFDKPVVYEHPDTHVETIVPATVARFRQVETHIRHRHHDALEFGDGTTITIARLLPGQHAVVLQLPSVPLHKPGQAEVTPSDASQRPISLLLT